MTTLPPPLTMTFDVACSADHAFEVWTKRIGAWWPRDHTVGGDREVNIVLQAGVGGRIYELGDDGIEHIWGEITAWEPPARLAYTWHIGRPASDATDVEIRFVAHGDDVTSVVIEQRGWERFGDDAQTWQARNRIGWESLAPHYIAAVTETRMTQMKAGTKDRPWVLRTPPGSSEYVMYRDADDPAVLVCQVGTTRLTYRERAINDLHSWLNDQGDWVPLGAADENKPAADGTVEAWARSQSNPVNGWYGLRKGYRGRFGMYLPPLLEALGLAEVTHEARNNSMRAL